MPSEKRDAAQKPVRESVRTKFYLTGVLRATRLRTLQLCGVVNSPGLIFDNVAIANQETL